MDDYDIYILDDEDTRNASHDHRTSSTSGGRRVVHHGSGIIRSNPHRVVRSPSRTVVVGSPARATRQVLGGLTVGELIQAAAQVLAAIQPLPASPVATGYADTDVANLILYQGALATHAKRDEQLRTLGSLVEKLID